MAGGIGRKGCLRGGVSALSPLLLLRFLCSSLSYEAAFRKEAVQWVLTAAESRVFPWFPRVCSAEGVAESILADVRRFLASASWYLKRGIPYRRGYLLHGPPGCGKSSFVMALAGELKYNICVLNVADPHMTDDRLQYLLAVGFKSKLMRILTVPPRSLLLLEDIDSAIRQSESAEGNKELSSVGEGPLLTQLTVNPYGARSITYSGLLNALDGVVATEERIIFLTTNQPERLPTSLIRPGRVDLKVRIGYATPAQLRQQVSAYWELSSALHLSIAAPLSALLRVMRLYCEI
ncbi:putative Bcs1 protein [Cyclospora cayetanensis]|uniref:Bcs1 protein n=1 Tax=Cyclospora cayetanensis TaxID=88456 RepID=A0A1D3CUY6_9EIME|nr:putative Bcs1 protein [Cyclospora cayetanensis]